MTGKPGGSVGPLIMARLLFTLKHDLAAAFSTFPKIMAETESDLNRCESPGEAQSVFIHCLHAMRECIAQMDAPCKRTLLSLGVKVESNSKDN